MKNICKLLLLKIATKWGFVQICLPCWCSSKIWNSDEIWVKQQDQNLRFVIPHKSLESFYFLLSLSTKRLWFVLASYFLFSIGLVENLKSPSIITSVKYNLFWLSRLLPPRKIVSRLGLGFGLGLGLVLGLRGGGIFLEGNCPRRSFLRIKLVGERSEANQSARNISLCNIYQNVLVSKAISTIFWLIKRSLHRLIIYFINISFPEQNVVLKNRCSENRKRLSKITTMIK